TAKAFGEQPVTSGPVSATESGPGTISNTATVDVIDPPTTTAAFNPTTINGNTTSVLTVTITNPNLVSPGPGAFSQPIDNVGFTYQLSPGLAVAPAPNVSGTCLTSARTPGIVIANPGAGSFTLFNLSLDGGASCSLTISVGYDGFTAPANYATGTGPVGWTY